jgi:hypothetical protein
VSDRWESTKEWIWWTIHDEIYGAIRKLWGRAILVVIIAAAVASYAWARAHPELLVGSLGALVAFVAILGPSAVQRWWVNRAHPERVPAAVTQQPALTVAVGMRHVLSKISGDEQGSRLLRKIQHGWNDSADALEKYISAWNKHLNEMGVVSIASRPGMATSSREAAQRVGDNFFREFESLMRLMDYEPQPLPAKSAVGAVGARSGKRSPDGFVWYEDWIIEQTQRNTDLNKQYVGRDDLKLDLHTYGHCTFDGCSIRWLGYPFDLVNCTFEPNTRWEINDVALRELARWLRKYCLVEKNAVL